MFRFKSDGTENFDTLCLKIDVHMKIWNRSFVNEHDPIKFLVFSL